MQSLFNAATTSHPVKSAAAEHGSYAATRRAGRLCGRILGRRTESTKPKAKYTKNLVLIDFQGQEAGHECPLYDYQKVFDGLFQFSSHHSEKDIREEIVRLVQLKETQTHRLELLHCDSFSFVKVRFRLGCYTHAIIIKLL